MRLRLGSVLRPSRSRRQERQAAPADNAVNLASTGAAIQSSFSQFSHADDPLRAVSGAPNGSFSFHTKYENEPWWLVDLGRICEIEKLVVFNRGNGGQSRIRHFRIDIFDPAVGGWKSIYAAENEFGGILDDNPLRLNFGAKPKVARFIKLAIKGENYLHLDKVEVFGASSQEAYEQALRQQARVPQPVATVEASRAGQRGLGAIVGLVRGYADLAAYEPLIARNAAIFETINKGRTTHYPLLIWHEGNISPEHQAHILANDQNHDVRFIDISDRWSLPFGLDSAAMQEHWTIGYRLMCKFNTVDIWDLTRSFDYVLRVDEDCILARIVVDPFQWMHDANLDCAFSWLVDDIHDLTNETLPPFVEAYLAVNGIRSESAWPLTSCFPYTNVMMGRGEFFRSPRVRHFLTQVIKQQNFYTKRWGDHIILGIPLNLYSSLQKVQPIKELIYSHDSHNVTVIADDQTRTGALLRSRVPDGSIFAELPLPERRDKLLECFKTWPINADIRDRLVRTLEESGHEAIARRLSGAPA